MGVAIIIGIIAGAGMLGGVSNYFMNRTDRNWVGFEFTKSALLGLTAAATVPLFLKTVSSNLMQECLAGDAIACFVLFGFCAVAAIFSSKFLQSLADKLLQEVNQVKQQQEEIAQTQDILVRQNSDPEESPATPPVAEAGGVDGNDLESFSTSRSGPAPSTTVMSDEQKIMLALRPGPGKFAFRTMDGISRDTGIDAKLLTVKMAAMESGGMLVKTKRASDGAILWSLK